MSKKKKDKKNGVEKLRKVLDDYSFEELRPEDEKYLKTLKNRLDKKSEEKVVFQKITHETYNSNDEDLLKPTVVIHERIKKKPVELPEFKEAEDTTPGEDQKETRLEDEDLIDIKKVKPDIPEFIEVKPKTEKKVEKIETKDVEEEFVPLEKEEIEKILEEEQPLEEKKEPVEFIKVEPGEKEVKKTEEIFEWESVESDEDIPKGEKIEEKLDEDIIFCSECGEKLKKDDRFCPNCGKTCEEEVETKNDKDQIVIDEEFEKVDVFESVEEDLESIERDRIIEAFKDLKSIDDETAIILYNNGYKDIDSIKEATIKDLTKIKGLKRKIAKQIKQETEEPEPETWEIPEETEIKPEKTIEEEKTEEVEESRVISVSETIYCSECGSVIDKDMLFCHKCGTKLKEEEDLEEYSDKDNIKLVTPGKKELTKEELKKIHDEIPTEEKIKPFEGLKTITYDTAIALYDSGYTSFDLLKNIDIKDLKKIKGIKSKTAKKIREELDEKIIESAQVKPIPIGESSEGIVTEEQIRKEDDFKEEKQPLHPVELSHNKKWESLENDLEITDDKEIGKEIEKEIKEEIEEEPEDTWEPIDEESIEGIEEKIEKEEEKEIKEKIKIFKEINSIDDETAIILYNNGYKDIDSIKTATIKDLTKIKGLKRKIAKQIKQETEEAEPETWEIPEETEIKPEKTIEEEKKETPKEEKEKLGDFGKTKIFKDFKSIDDETAIKLYDYGFISVDILKLADIKELRKVNGIKRKKAKEIMKEIEGIHAEDKIAEMVMEEDAEYFKDEEFFKEEEKQLDNQIKEFEDKEEPILDEELFIEEEILEELPETKIEEEVKESKDKDEFSKIPSIDGKISDLLHENNIDTIEELSKKTIKDLTKIKGIRKKVAKQIKKEIEEHLKTIDTDESHTNLEENPYINEEGFSEEDEWESFEEHSKKEKKASTKKGFIYGDYTLYEKEITTKDDKKRKVRFFSKGEPEDAEPIKLPKGYEIKENKKTNVPYLKKKK